MLVWLITSPLLSLKIDDKDYTLKSALFKFIDIIYTAMDSFKKEFLIDLMQEIMRHQLSIVCMDFSKSAIADITRLACGTLSK